MADLFICAVISGLVVAGLMLYEIIRTAVKGERA